ncbi:MAG: hypothetical protein HQK49_06020 [Oligoflexia bacterium]|nr:hypothetical protein [Oligoflexia bacterium]
MKAEIRHYSKKIYKNGVIVEMCIWKVNASKEFPEGIKYRLICVNPTKGIRVLIDNHSPKGHHYHLDDNEFEYEFNGVNKLALDFKQFVLLHMRIEI